MFLVLSIASAVLINFILFESIKKTAELMINGQMAEAELVNLENFRLKFSNGNQIYFFEGKRSSDFNGDIGAKVPIVFNATKPESAATISQFKMLKSFLVPLSVLFLVLVFAIYSMIRKIYLNLSLFVWRPNNEGCGRYYFVYT